MTAELAASSRRARPRPQVHFTANDGWINDPYGVAWIHDRYHLYYQAVPGRVTWAPNCHWGHAESPDLVHWTERELALTPQDFEVGCWSGSVVQDADPPTIFYTRVLPDEVELGQVAVATLDDDGQAWRSTANDVVVDGPPQGLPVRSFRDPFVFRSEWGWRMLMAAALADGTAAVLQYRSDDLRQWSYDGVLCSRPGNRSDEVWTGALWECPQLFQMDDRWVLLVSVWDAGALHYVAAAVGDYDGSTFTPQRWQRLTFGSSAYAMSTFVDRDERRCVLSWLREEPQNNEDLTERAGAHSLPGVLALDAGGVLTMRPHPDVDALRRFPADGKRSGSRITFDVGDSAIDLVIGSRTRCQVQEHGSLRLTVSIDPGRGVLVLDRPGYGTDELPLTPGAQEVRIVLDADVVEAFDGTTYGAYRIAPALDPDATTVVLSGDGASEAALWPLASSSTPPKPTPVRESREAAG